MKKIRCRLTGFLKAVKKINSTYFLPLPEYIAHLKPCYICLGDNVPGQTKFNEKTKNIVYDYPKGGWCCGSICEGSMPIFGICERFKVDNKKVEDICKDIRKEKKETVGSVTTL